ncbi:MAG: CaiB/BaiF CoA transferase family protein [Ignavibacteriales bacterium]
MKPLEGIKILDLTWVYSGPYCTLLLNDMGADVVKLESPLTGDYTRYFPPLKNNWSGYFYMLNRGKKSITLNLKSEEGKQIYLDLIKHFDVVTENFVPGILDKLGIGYETARKINPKIIYASISGFGRTGPYSKMACVDPVAQAMGGLMSMTGYPGQQPLKTGPAVADALAGMNLAIGILGALHMRQKTGQGQQVESAMMDSVFAILEEAVIRTSMTGDPLPARGNTDPLGAPWDAFPTSDHQWIMVCGFGGDKFDTIYRLIGRADIADEYAGYDMDAIEKRSRDLNLINAAFAEWTITVTADELVQFCNEVRIPCGPVKDVKELIHDPQILAREMVIDVDHPQLGAVKTFNLPIKFYGAEAGIKPGSAPLDPGLGQHNLEIYGDLLHINKDSIKHLKDTGVI